MLQKAKERLDFVWDGKFPNSREGLPREVYVVPSFLRNELIKAGTGELPISSKSPDEIVFRGSEFWVSGMLDIVP